MADRTDFAHLTRLDPSDPISADGYGLQDRNVRMLDYLLRLLWNQRGDGHAALVDPAIAPDSTVDAAGGQIPSDLTLSVGYTLLDQDGGETILSPLTVVETPAGLAAPDDSPTLTPDATAGTLLANTYTYAVTLTDGQGGETALGPSAIVTIPSGSGTNRIVVDGLDLLLAGGAVGWRLWRSIGGEDFHLIAQGAGAQVIDDGSLAADCGVAPPSITGTTNATAVLNVTVPAGQPADAAQYRVYVAIDGDFSGPSLLGTYPVAELNALKTYTELAFLGSSPPEDSTTMPATSGGGGGGGGGLFSYPADYAADLVANMDGVLDGSRVILGLTTAGANPIALLREGAGEWRWIGSFANDNDNSTDIGHVEHPAGFFAADAPGMRDGRTTVKFQLDAVDDPNFLGSVAAFIGHRDGPRTYARLSWDGAGTYYMDTGVEDMIVDNDNESVGFANAALALAADTNYWLRVTRTGGQIGGACYAEDPDANPAAVPLLEVPLTDEAQIAALWHPALRTNGLPGFGWSYTDDTNRASLIRFYGLTAHAENGGDGYDPLVASRIAVLDNGSAYSPVRELEFVGFGVTDQRSRFDRMTVSLPGMRNLGFDSFTWAGALGGYLTQNVAVDNFDVKANLAGDDGRVVLAPAPGWWTLQTRALFIGAAADDAFGVMLKATDIDSYILVRVNNVTGAPVLEIVDVNDGVETVLKSIAFNPSVTNGSAANYWDVADPVWVAGEFNNGFIGAAVYDMEPDLDMASPLHKAGVKLTGATAARYAIQGGYGLSLVPAAGGGNTLRGTELSIKSED